MEIDNKEKEIIKKIADQVDDDIFIRLSQYPMFSLGDIMLIRYAIMSGLVEKSTIYEMLDKGSTLDDIKTYIQSLNAINKIKV